MNSIWILRRSKIGNEESKENKDILMIINDIKKICLLFSHPPKKEPKKNGSYRC